MGLVIVESRAIDLNLMHGFQRVKLIGSELFLR